LHYHSSMTPILEAEARLTSQNQITIPAPIRKALHLRGGQSRVKFQVLPEDGRVLVVRVDPPVQRDPALKPFLDLLAKDLKKHPERIKPIPAGLVRRVRSVIEGVEIDLNGPLTGED
jgi:antitoxin PrlF